jgi:hypothetical protein
MNDPFAQSRAQLRNLLMGPDFGDDTFPRSGLMRSLLNPRNRAMLVTAASLTAVLFPRIRRLGMIGQLARRLAKF